MRDEHELVTETIEEREQRLDRETRELDLHNFKNVALPVLALFLVGCLVICCMSSAEAQYRGYYGSGTVIREEVNPTQFITPNYDLQGYESFSITEDVNNNGFIGRETTYYDCRNDMFGKQICEERMW